MKIKLTILKTIEIMGHFNHKLQEMILSKQDSRPNLIFNRFKDKELELVDILLI
jgi:hypothetical protein